MFMAKERKTEEPTILIIDDDEDVLNMMVEGLRMFGRHSVIGSSDPQQALQLIATTLSLKLLLSDVQLGSTTGPTLIREALKDRPGLVVIFMSGDFGGARVRKTDPVLHKPVGLTQVCAVVEDALHSEKPTFIPRDDGVERRRSQSVCVGRAARASWWRSISGSVRSFYVCELILRDRGKTGCHEATEKPSAALVSTGNLAKPVVLPTITRAYMAHIFQPLFAIPLSASRPRFQSVSICMVASIAKG